MLATDTRFLEVLLPAAIRLHETMVAEGATTPAAIDALLARLAPDLDADARRFVLRLELLPTAASRLGFRYAT